MDYLLLCDEKFMLGLHSLYIVEEEEEIEEDKKNGKEFNLKVITSYIYIYISINALERTAWFYTLRVTCKVSKHSLFIMVNSWNTHNFINTQVANKLYCNLKYIKPLAMKAINSGAMIYIAICKDFRWKIKEVNFLVDVFVVEFNNNNMVLRIK